MNEKHALKLAREDLSFAVDRFMQELHCRYDDPYVRRLMGTIKFITEVLDDEKEFSDLAARWEKNGGSMFATALRNFK